MQTRFLAPVLLAVLPWIVSAAEPSASAPEALYVLSVRGAVAEDGKALTMTVRETERTADFSVVDVDYVAGGGASSLFLVRGLCGLMLARGHDLAVAEQVSDRPVRFRMTFPAGAGQEDRSGRPRIVLSRPDCARISAQHQ